MDQWRPEAYVSLLDAFASVFPLVDDESDWEVRG